MLSLAFSHCFSLLSFFLILFPFDVWFFLGFIFVLFAIVSFGSK